MVRSGRKAQPITAGRRTATDRGFPEKMAEEGCRKADRERKEAGREEQRTAEKGIGGVKEKTGYHQDWGFWKNPAR